MEIVHLIRGTFYNQLQQSIYLCHKRNMRQIWQLNTLCRAKRSHHVEHPQPLTNVHTKRQPSTPTRSKIWPKHELKLMVTATRSKMKLQ